MVKLKKGLKQSYKKILKKDKLEVKIKEYEPQSIFNDTNRFFNGGMEEAKRSLFFS